MSVQERRVRSTTLSVVHKVHHLSLHLPSRSVIAKTFLPSLVFCGRIHLLLWLDSSPTVVWGVVSVDVFRFWRTGQIMAVCLPTSLADGRHIGAGDETGALAIVGAVETGLLLRATPASHEDRDDLRETFGPRRKDDFVGVSLACN